MQRDLVGGLNGDWNTLALHVENGDVALIAI
jgi:hypothetical protein